MDPMWLYMVGFAVGMWFGGKIERGWLIDHPAEFFRASAQRKAKHGQR